MKDTNAEKRQGDDVMEADCEETFGRLYTFLDGELTEDRRSAIRAHLDGCGPCLDVLEFESELRRVISDKCKDHVPDALMHRIAEALDRERAERKSQK